jgi:hypothetical protein
VLGAKGPTLCPNTAAPGTFALQPGTLDIGNDPGADPFYVAGVLAGFYPLMAGSANQTNSGCARVPPFGSLVPQARNPQRGSLQHPEIEVVNRDRAGAYAEAAANGAPQAIQVADRWHLLCNLTQAIQRMLERLSNVVRQLCSPK